MNFQRFIGLTVFALIILDTLRRYILWEKISADDILKFIFFLLFSKQVLMFYANYNLHKISNPFFGGKSKKNVVNLLSAE